MNKWNRFFSIFSVFLFLCFLFLNLNDTYATRPPKNATGPPPMRRIFRWHESNSDVRACVGGDGWGCTPIIPPDVGPWPTMWAGDLNISFQFNRNEDFFRFFFLFLTHKMIYLFEKFDTNVNTPSKRWTKKSQEKKKINFWLYCLVYSIYTEIPLLSTLSVEIYTMFVVVYFDVTLFCKKKKKL